jgi:DNA-binding GntR family transcriptional regulator
LGVSRTPVREAIQRLKAEGLVQYVRRNSAVISSIARREIEEIFEVRTLLEGYAAQRGATALDKKAAKKLHELIDEMDNLHSRNDVSKLMVKNEEFHRTVCALAGNHILVEMLEKIWRDIRRLRFGYLVTRKGHERSTREHKALVDALEKRDRAQIRKIVQLHANGTLQGILETLPQEPDSEAGSTDSPLDWRDVEESARPSSALRSSVSASK